MIILCLVEEKIKGQMVKKHILDLENFKHILTAFGDKLTEEDMDDIFGEFEYDDDGNIFTKVTMTISQRKVRLCHICICVFTFVNLSNTQLQNVLKVRRETRTFAFPAFCSTT
jgi:hypothetical protein